MYSYLSNLILVFMDAIALLLKVLLEKTQLIYASESYS